MCTIKGLRKEKRKRDQAEEREILQGGEGKSKELRRDGANEGVPCENPREKKKEKKKRKKMREDGPGDNCRHLQHCQT